MPMVSTSCLCGRLSYLCSSPTSLLTPGLKHPVPATYFFAGISQTEHTDSDGADPLLLEEVAETVT